MQIVNVRPGAPPQTQTAGQQKTVATVSPRVVISNSPQLVATRPPNNSVRYAAFYILTNFIIA